MAGDRRTRVLVAGNGVAGLEAVLALQSLAPGRLELSMLAPERHFTYRPLAAGAPFARATPARVELAAIARDRGFELTRDAVDRVDAAAHEVVTQEGAQLSYDVLVLALGARPVVAVQGAVAFRGSHDAPTVAAALEAVGSPARVAYVARSAAMWTLPLYELALHTAAWGARRDAGLEVLVVTEEARPLSAVGGDASDRLATLLAGSCVRFIPGTVVDHVRGGHLRMAAAAPIAVDLAVALPHLVGPRVDGLPHDAQGFARVDATGRMRGVDDVYAIGDMTDRPLRHDALAAEQADVAAAAIAAAAGASVHGGRLLGDAAPGRSAAEFAGFHLAPYLGTHGDLEPVA
ncbi:MAG: sulfide:quinone oxidoreductase [Solirubrobacteraceae bacterium]|nr:sulfide:quinone oxidoreductase [Solirubrobacteraceae bacterium]